MNKNPLKQGVLTENATGLGTVTRQLLRERACELAIINGRSAQDVSKSDWEQAKRELTGQPDVDPQTAALEAAPESERWDPVPGATGHKVADLRRADAELYRAALQYRQPVPFDFWNQSANGLFPPPVMVRK